MWVRGLKRKAVAEAIGQEKSHPMWVRGLKHLLSYFNKLKNMSHPMWVRGLKLYFGDDIPYLSKSHPMWVRGLKQLSHDSNNSFEKVAPYVGAWIETDTSATVNAAGSCRTLCGCVD